MEYDNTLDVLAIQKYRTAFKDTYWKATENAGDQDEIDRMKRDAMGILIAQWCEWGGFEVCEIFYSALEDSNFHTLNEKIEALVIEERKRWDDKGK
jgi:hypothetical protein